MTAPDTDRLTETLADIATEWLLADYDPAYAGPETVEDATRYGRELAAALRPTIDALLTEQAERIAADHSRRPHRPTGDQP